MAMHASGENRVNSVSGVRAGGFGFVFGVARGDDSDVLRQSRADVVVLDLDLV
jgi:hypothetical protein